MNSQDLTDIAVQLKLSHTALADYVTGLLTQVQGVETNVAKLALETNQDMLAAKTAAGITTSGGSVPTTNTAIAAYFAAYSGKTIWYDPSSSARGYQDTGTTTAVTTAGQTFGRLSDLSGENLHGIQSASGKRPVYGLDNGRSFVSFDGVDDGLHTSSSLDGTGTNKLTLIIGMVKRNADGTTMVTELGPEFTTGGSFGLYINQAAPEGYMSWGASGATDNPTPVIPSPVPDRSVFTCQIDLAMSAGWSMRIQRNNDEILDTAVAGNRNLVNQVLNIGCRNDASLFAPIDLYSYMLLAGPFPSPSDLLMLRSYAAEKTGVTL